MKKHSLLHKAMSLAGSAVLLAGLITGFGIKNAGVLTVSAKAAEQVSVGSYYQVEATSLNIRTGPGFNYSRKGGLTEGSLVKVLEARGSWARIDSGWINIDYLEPASSVVYPASKTSLYVRVPVLNVRRGPGVEYAVCGQVTQGYKLTVGETRDGWGKIPEGWVSMEYLSSSGKPVTEPPANNAENYVNTTVQVTADRLNVRQGPGLGYAKVSSLSNGTRVTIQEVRSGWGRINEGWISLSYVQAVNGSGNRVTPGLSGTVEVTAQNLRIRTGPGTNYSPCGALTNGYRASVSDVQDGWGKIDGGWIDLDYTRWIR